MKGTEKQLSGHVEFWCLAGNLVLSSLLSGGYLQPVAALLCISLGVAVVAEIWKNGKVVISCDRYAVLLFLIATMYLIVSLWAIDKGMAVSGFVHFLPVFLFYLLYCRNMDRKEELIALLPVFGSLMTLFSFIMMQFPVFQDYVSVANRLSGFFQYPNTYALFMMVCLIVTAYRLQEEKTDWLDVVHCGAAFFGIYMSGSRITFLMLIGILFCFLLQNRKMRKIVLPIAATLLAVVAVLSATGITGNLFGRLLDLSANSSTLLGRLLYTRDAIPIILCHPFGTGYYGYYFLQAEFQTGVYSVVNVHNELLQMALDIGVVPALLFYGGIFSAALKKDVPSRDKMVVLVILIHSLLDYDFQFLSIYFVLIMFLDLRKVKEYPVSMFTKAISVALFDVVVFGAVCVGISDLQMMKGQYEKAVQAYDGNTLAKTYYLTEIEDMQELQEMALSITAQNQHVPLAYHALAQVALAKGKVSEYLENKEHAIELAPYDSEAYIEYLDVLSDCFERYRTEGDKDSAGICVQRAKEVPELLEQLKKRTSWLGWKIDDMPQVELPWEYQQMVEKMEREYREMK